MLTCHFSTVIQSLGLAPTNLAKILDMIISGRQIAMAGYYIWMMNVAQRQAH